MTLNPPNIESQPTPESWLAHRRRELRFSIFALTTLAQFLIGLFASTVPVDRGLAQEIKDSLPPNPDAMLIFSHNLLVAAAIFVPGFGLGWLSLLIWETGIAFSALGPLAMTPVPGWVAWLDASSTPFFWLEIMAYSAAAAASTMFLLTLVFDRKKLLFETTRFGFGVVIYVLLLWNAASIELTNTIAGIYLEWITVAVVGTIALVIYSTGLGPRLLTRDWVVMLGLLLTLGLVPFVYVPLLLGYLLYFFWRGPVPTVQHGESAAQPAI